MLSMDGHGADRIHKAEALRIEDPYLCGTQETYSRRSDTKRPTPPMSLINQSHWSDVTCSLFAHRECK